MKTLLIILSLLLFTGCSDQKRWKLDYELSSSDGKAAAEHVEKIMSATPKSLGGHDQDWDDVIREAHEQATKLYGRPVMREWVTTWDNYPLHPTGRFRYLQEVQTEQPSEGFRGK